jgi:hypothetical protein
MNKILLPMICLALVACSETESSSPTNSPQTNPISSENTTTYELDCNGELLTFTDINAYSTAKATCAQTAAQNQNEKQKKEIVVKDSVQKKVYVYHCDEKGDFILSMKSSREICDSINWTYSSVCRNYLENHASLPEGVHCLTKCYTNDKFVHLLDYLSGNAVSATEVSDCKIDVTPTDNLEPYRTFYYVKCNTQFYQDIWTISEHIEYE